jgi:PAS domain S-box-containing protein
MVEISWSLSGSDELAGLRADTKRVLEASGASDAYQQDVVLILTELATNALTHAHDPYRLSLVVTQDCDVVLATDGGGGRVAARVPMAGDGGYGLGITAALSQSWGCASSDKGKTVWAVLARDHHESPVVAVVGPPSSRPTQGHGDVGDGRTPDTFDALAVLQLVPGVNVDFDVRFANQAFVDLIGRSAAEVLSQRWSRLRPDGSGVELAETFADALQTGQRHERVGIVIENTDLTGSVIADVRVTGFGETVVCEGRNTTTPSRSLPAIEHSQSHFEAAQRLAHLGTFDFDLTTGTLRFSDEMHRICGLDPERDEVRSLNDVLWLLDAREAQRIPELIPRAGDAQHPIEEEFSFTRPDGETRVAALLIETVIDAHGRPRRLRGTALDVTIRRHNETELLAYRRALDEAQRLAQLGSWHYDLAAGTSLWSAQMYPLLGRNPADGPMPIGRWRQMVHPDDAEIVHDAERRAVRLARAFSYEARMVRDEEEWVAAVRGEPILDDLGTVVAVHGTAQDITDRRAAQNALIASEAARAAEHAAIEALQHSLLPAALPRVDHLTIAARYEPAGDGTLFGGDWYDAYVLPDGQLVIALGDVAGHGLDAVATAAQLRNAARAYTVQNASPAAALTALDRLVHQLHPNDMATMILGTYDPARLTITFARAGHPQPIVHTPGAPPTPLALDGGLPLGAGHATRIPYRDTTVPLRDDTRLVLYSDGCIEQRNRSLTDGITELLRVVADAADLPDLCDRAVALPIPKAEDDRCVLAIHLARSRTN